MAVRRRVRRTTLSLTLRMKVESIQVGEIGMMGIESGRKKEDHEDDNI